MTNKLGIVRYGLFPILYIYIIGSVSEKMKSGYIYKKL